MNQSTRFWVPLALMLPVVGIGLSQSDAGHIPELTRNLSVPVSGAIQPIVGTSTRALSRFLVTRVPSVIAWQTADPAAGRFGDQNDISRELERIRDQPEFRRLRKSKPRPVAETKTPQWLEDFWDWLTSRKMGDGPSLSVLGAILQVIAYAVVALIAAGIIWLLVKAVQRYRAKYSLRIRGNKQFEEGEAGLPPGDLPSDEYLRRAAEFAERSMYREAIGQLILGAMSRIERANLIRFRRGLTHRDYLRAVRSRAVPHQALRQIVTVYEPICFGRRPAQREHYQTSLDGYQTGFLQSFDEATAPRQTPLASPTASAHS
ncbi:MAG: DUF4129 domain-containing protein [Planctomycetes bacterium]|nr:DUF4129 domain-containing protein [Planctomycetota bacterium]